MAKFSSAAHAAPAARRLAAGNAGGPASLAEFFWCFSALGRSGFGGVTPRARRLLVDRKKWISDLEFAALLSLGQLLPGSNISNMAIMLGRQYFGWRGAVAAICGLHMFPLCIIVALGLGWFSVAPSSVTVLLLLRSKWNPLSLILAGAVTGLLN